MAEGGVDKAFGAEPEGPEAEGHGLSAADALAMAVASEESRRDPDLNLKLGAYVEEQRRLVTLQIKHFDEERRLAIAAAKRKRLSDRLRISLQLFVALIATGAIGVLGAMAVSAYRDHGLVVEAFSVAPDLTQRGLTGQVVAKQLLDRMSYLQAQTASMRAPSTYRNNWGDDVRVEIPQTGISVGELRRFLHEALSHSTRISGEIYRSPAGLTVTARVGEEPATRFTGNDTELESLLDQAAEAAYEATQPYRYVVYLDRVEPTSKGRAITERLKHSADPTERAWAYVHSGLYEILRGDVRAVAAGMKEALREEAAFAPALWNLAYTEGDLAHDQDAVRYAAAYLAADRSVQRDIRADQRGQIEHSVRWIKAQLEGDYPEATRQGRELARGPVANLVDESRSNLPMSLVLNHDLDAARAAAHEMEPGDPGRLLIPGLAALETGDPSAVELIRQAAQLAAAWPWDNTRDVLRQPILPRLAIAQARLGDTVSAAASLQSTGTDCYLCLRARGQVAAIAGDRAAAEQWFAAAIQLGPALPQAFVDRGNAHLAWKDPTGAIADAERATRLTPRNADAWKLWGDALASQGQPSKALRKYDEALRHAPHWEALVKARDAAATSKD